MYLQKNFNYIKAKEKMTFRKIRLYTGINLHTLSKLSHGNENNIRIETIMKICSLFKLSLDGLIYSDLEHEIIQISNTENDHIHVQKNIKYLKKINKLSYKDICIPAQINENTLHILLNGNGKNIRIETVVKIAHYFNLNLDDLVNNDFEYEVCTKKVQRKKE